MMEIQRRITQPYFNLARHQYAPLIHKLAFRIGISQENIDELKTQGVKELLKCMICYNKSGSFMTFFYGRLEGVFKHMRDKEKRAKRIPTMSLDFMRSLVEPYRDISANMAAQECLKYLDEDERKVVVEIFFNDKTMRELSHDCGVVPSTIYRIKTKAINKIKQRCNMGVEVNHGT